MEFDISNVKGAIFDMDGTILDSMIIWEDISTRYLTLLGIEPEPDLNRIVSTMTFMEGCTYIKERYHIDDRTVFEIQNEITELIKEFYYYEVLPLPGAVRIIKDLYKNGIPMVVATTGDEDVAIHAFKRIGILDYFEEILTCTRYNTSKREPLIFEKAKEIIERKSVSALDNHNIYVFEDSIDAVLTAKKSGLSVVGIREKFSRNSWEQIEKAADITVDTLNDLY